MTGETIETWHFFHIRHHFVLHTSGASCTHNSTSLCSYAGPHPLKFVSRHCGPSGELCPRTGSGTQPMATCRLRRHGHIWTPSSAVSKNLSPPELVQRGEWHRACSFPDSS